MSATDQELLARFVGQRAEDAFTEIVKRHIDLIHSAALRQVRSSQLAEEVAQSTFVNLARHAHELAPGTVLAAWLYQVARRESIDVIRREARRQLREQIATELYAMNAATSDWAHLEPVLDEAVNALDATDRAAVLLRFFEGKSFREVGQALGASENAAQKRIARSVEQLRVFLARRGVTIGSSAMVAAITAHAVQAAPLGLAAAISTSAIAVAGTTVAAAATATSAQVLAMSTLKKAFLGAAFIAAVGAGIQQSKQASRLSSEKLALLQGQADLNGRIEELTRERDDTAGRLNDLHLDALQRESEHAELLRLRGVAEKLQRQLGLATNGARGVSPSGASALPAGLRRPRRVEEFKNVGRETAEAVVETALWAAQYRPGDLLEMVYLAPETLDQFRLQEGGMRSLEGILAGNLRSLLSVALGPTKLVWVGSTLTPSSVTVHDSEHSYTYAGLADFRLCGREVMDDPATERYSDIYAARIEGQWKIVFTGMSPETKDADTP